MAGASANESRLSCIKRSFLAHFFCQAKSLKFDPESVHQYFHKSKCCKGYGAINDGQDIKTDGIKIGYLQAI
jgi:hypothetical protein